MSLRIFPQLRLEKRRIYIVILCLCLVVIGVSWVVVAMAAQAKSSGKQKQNSGKTATSRKAQRLKKRSLAPALEPSQEKEEFEQDAERKQEWFLYQRIYPFDELPQDARRQAWDTRLPNAPQSLLQTWTSLGPQPTNSAFPSNWGNTSGRINTIAVSPANPNLILIGSATGGIWRSTNGGASFAAVTDSQVDLAVGSIAFAPGNNSIVYAGMGDGQTGSYLGSGVLKSTDSGQTWTRISNNTLPSPGTTMAIAVSPTDPNLVYLAQYSAQSGNSVFSSGFYYSTDGGVNWTRTLIGLARGLVIHPATESTLYLAMSRVDEGGNSPGVYRSIDSGQTWTRIYTSPFASTSDVRVAVTPANPQAVYVYAGGTTGTFSIRVEVSTNGGDSFTNLGAPGVDNSQFGYNTYIQVSPTDTNTIYLGTRDVFKSTNGGAGYTNLTRSFNSSGGYTPGNSNAHPDQHSFAFLPGNANTLFIGNDGGLYKSVDGGANFTSLNNGLSLSMFIGLAIHPTDPTRTYGGTQDNGNQKRLTTGAPAAWREYFGGDGGRTVINPLNPSIIFATYVYGTIFRFDSNGDSFTSTVADNSTFGEPASGQRIAFYPPFTGNGVNANLYFGTYRLFVSTNLGASWTPPGGSFDQTKGGSDVLSALSVARSNSNVIYSGSRQGRAMVSINGGTSWTDISTGIPNRSITSITVHPTDPATAYLTVSGYGTGHIFKTTNSGTNWTDISGSLPNIPANALLIDPLNANTIYAGTDIGVFRSDTGGTNWATFNSGLPPVIVMAFASQASGLIQLGSYGRGVYELSGTACTYNITPTSQSFTAAGGANTVNLTTNSLCAWTATSNLSWITITNSNGIGSGAVGYVVQVNASGNQRTGTLTIAGQTFTVTQAGGVACSLALPISVGQTLTGQLSAGDCVRTNGSLADLYTFSGTAGQQIAINLNSQAFDGYLLLANPAGTILTEDDNGGSGVNARIPAGSGLYTLPSTGSYIIFASSAASAQTGDYSLSLTGPSGGGLQFYPLAHPVRLLETRAGFTGCFAPGAPIQGGATRTQVARGLCDGLAIPANAAAITGNITTVQSGGGYLTLYPSNAAQPLVANSNYGPNEIVNNVFTVGLGPSDGAFKIYVQATTDVVVDVTGYYAPPGTGGLYFHPLPKPIRLLETRAGFSGCFAPATVLQGGMDIPQQARLTCDGITIPAAAMAIVGNATTIGPAGIGYLTLFPSDAARPLAASSNYGANQIINGPFTVGLSSAGQFKIYSSVMTDLAVDVLGYYSAEASDANGAGLFFSPLAKPVRLLETRASYTGCYTPGASITGSTVFTQQSRGQCSGETVSDAALSVVGNATVVNSNGGYLTLWPSNANQPAVATSNFNASQISNRHFTVGLGPDGAFKIFAQFTTDLVLDLSGYFAP